MGCTATHRIRERSAENRSVMLESTTLPSVLDIELSLDSSAVSMPVVDLAEVTALYREVFEAQQVQRRLSGPRRLQRGQFEIAAEIFPVQHFSGDFVCIFDCGDSTLLALGDVAGKGLTAAMWSTHVMSLLRTSFANLRKPNLVASAINRDLCALGSGAPITTMVLAILDWQGDELTYCNAGHFPPFIKRQNGAVQRISAGGPALGAIPLAEFEETRVPFSPSDMFVGYSDGLIECLNGNDEEFGIERLLAQARNCQSQPASTALFSMIAAAQDFAHGTPRTDDLSLLIVSGASPR
ncbi:MAG: serine/threonine-protein phosphatase [Acidobacteria bacterium]|nr:MAG: serine/threonine-protein phosphatase [Acidobacteriota bacterium]PYY23223.1 MAG: serine/threonine-protein phosphatase [Acidobacteriota bacterium]